MTTTSLPADNPFVDPVSTSFDNAGPGTSFVVDATLALGRDASLTLGTDSLILLGTSKPRTMCIFNDVWQTRISRREIGVTVVDSGHLVDNPCLTCAYSPLTMIRYCQYPCYPILQRSLGRTIQFPTHTYLCLAFVEDSGPRCYFEVSGGIPHGGAGQQMGLQTARSLIWRVATEEENEGSGQPP